ncbi:MAG: GntR family transcriptional regulator [Lawsonibacter sp.]|nr:GntR family transcriptional regulator [Lawsonibacter sp.]
MANQAYDYLYQKIMRCEYLPGQELNEKLLVEETGFGRTPLREALLLLQKEGMVDIFPRKGMRISLMTEKSVKDLYQTRKLIEPTVIEEYKTLYSKGRLIQYQQSFQQSADAPDLDRFLLDIDFHAYLISITDNKILMEMYNRLMLIQARLAMYAALKNAVNAREDDLAQHCAIIDALLRENEHDIRDTVILHINYSMIRSLNAIQNNPQ